MFTAKLLLVYCFLFILQDAATLYALWPDGTCERMGLSGQYNTSLTTMLAAVVNASNSPAVAAAINGQLAGLGGSIAGGGGGASDQMTQQVRGVVQGGGMSYLMAPRCQGLVY